MILDREEPYCFTARPLTAATLTVGFNDGISQPFVKFQDDDEQDPKREKFPGQTVINPGVLVLGQPGDTSTSGRPSWAKNGSFLVYRHLKQLVPEFNQFLNDVVKALITRPHVTKEDLEKEINFLGARLMGRWKSGMIFVAS